ncbi:unnamed protein product [Dibothriocephalus latus]|uniref:Uncharacterized protein n=1 Tax=Dibothriocephalus latus TaxID=60516 RepID=A0A3P7QCB4_DIBLA|nr:unnamed protein product [Dibothriocephalus latus]
MDIENVGGTDGIECFRQTAELGVNFAHYLSALSTQLKCCNDGADGSAIFPEPTKLPWGNLMIQMPIERIEENAGEYLFQEPVQKEKM